MKKAWLVIGMLLSLTVVGCHQADPEAAVPDTAVPENVGPEDGQEPVETPIEAPSKPIASDPEIESQPVENPTVEPPALTAPGATLLPVDEGDDHASFNTFRTQLIAAVKNKDTDFLLGIVHPDIKIGFGGGGGLEDFKQRWQIEDPNSQLWNELEAVLSLGGAFYRSNAPMDRDTDLFVAPYVFANFPDEYSGFEYAAIVADDVALREEPDVSLDAIAQLSYHIVKVDRSQSIEDETRRGEFLWVKVATTEGQAGYVEGPAVRSPIDYRAFFENEDGKWWMTFFAAGD
ncbi:MAG: hypothetical protein AAGF01_21915 [Cyanobacteria bacterium P01_G01_bin.38]